MQITLIRHLPTEWNKQSLLQGRKDIPIATLTENEWVGIERNKLILNKLEPFDLVLASTLQRTHQTAQLHGYNPGIEPLLDELYFGPFEGQSKDTLIELSGNSWIENPLILMLGESVINLGRRIERFFQKYLHKKNILVFGHGCWIRALISYHRFGHYNNMNKLDLDNNECVTLSFSPLRESSGRGRES